jgi:hypothetical protein
MTGSLAQSFLEPFPQLLASQDLTPPDVLLLPGSASPPAVACGPWSREQRSGSSTFRPLEQVSSRRVLPPPKELEAPTVEGEPIVTSN